MVFSRDNETKAVVATIKEGADPVTYECNILACNNPICTCGSVYITFSPLKQIDINCQISSYQVDINVKAKTLAYQDEKKIPEDQLRFAHTVLTQLDEDDFRFLWEMYFNFKNEITEKAAIDAIDAYFDYGEVESQGLMSAYNDVLPYGEHLLFTINDIACVVFDQYCLLPKCSCTDTTLTVFRSEEIEKPVEELCTVALSYRKKNWELLEGQSLFVSVATVRTAIEQIPDFYQKLVKRHMRLKGIYAHCKKRHYASVLKSAESKVGRNDPCPCGSGKKYKKCCLKKGK